MKKRIPKRIPIIIALVVIGIAILACANPPSAPAPAPTPVPASEQRTYPIEQIYDEALASSAKIVDQGMDAKANLNGIAIGLWIIAGMLMMSFLVNSVNGCGGLIVVALIFSALGYTQGNSSVAKLKAQTVNEVSHAQANNSVNGYLEIARTEQAKNFQLIAATMNAYGVEIMKCTDPINRKSDCSEVSNYYTNHDVNCDSDGDNCDTQHVSWYDYLVRYWAAPATRAKYIFEGIYDFRCINPETMSLETCTRDDKGMINDKRQPAIFLNKDWRPPVGAEVRWQARTLFGTYNANSAVPKLWQDLKNAKEQAASAKALVPTITGYFVGKYFHWGFGAKSPWATVYDGPYNQLKSLTKLSGPNGAWFNYQDAQGRTVSMTTMLYSEDGDLPTKINPVFFIGFDRANPAVVENLNTKGREFQGTYGPGKESINFDFIVNTEIVQAMGGMQNVTTAIMGWLQDEKLNGLFRMPKNQTLVIVEASADATSFSKQVFETGLPFGNELVKRDVRLAVTSPKPLTWDNLMGVVSSTYIPVESSATPAGANWGQKLTYQFSDMRQAGGIISMLYKNELPEYAGQFAQPDPNSDTCSSARPEHVGYIREQMCTQEILQTTIQINDDGKLYILNKVASGSRVDTSGEGSSILFALGVLFALGAFKAKAITL